MPKYATLKNSFLIIFLLTPISVTAAASSSRFFVDPAKFLYGNNTMPILPHGADAPPYDVVRRCDVDSGRLFNRACVLAAQNDAQCFEAIPLFTQLFHDPVYSPTARYKAALLTEGAHAKNHILAPLIATDSSAFHRPEIGFALQKKACDILIQAYTNERINDSALISAQNKLAVTLNHAIDRNIELKYFPRNCLNALTIISDSILTQSNIELLYLPCEGAIEQGQFLNKVFNSAAKYGVTSAALMLVLTSADKAQACQAFAPVYQQYGSRAIEDLCTAIEYGHPSACELALALATTETYAEAKLTLLNAAAATGNALAHYKLGRHYKEILTKSNDKSSKEIEALKTCAKEHLTIAADAKLPEAQLDLATMPKSYTQMIAALSPFANDTTFALQAVAQQYLADVLCSWASHCLQNGVSVRSATPVDSYLLAIALLEKAIYSVKYELDDHIFNKYSETVINFATLTPNSAHQQKAYDYSLSFLEEQIAKHPAAKNAYNVLVRHRMLSTPDVAISIQQIQERDYFINQIINHIKQESDFANKTKLWTIAETYLNNQPSNAMVASLKGIVAFCKDDYKTACEYFTSVVKDNPQDVFSQYLLSIAPKE